jgi:hypothetical protein
MNKIAVAAVCVLLISVMAAPGFCGVAYKKSGTLYRIGNSAYDRGVSFVENTETHLTGVVRNAFSLFNPCLDLVKGCTSLVLVPIEAPVNYISRATRTKRGSRSGIPVPKKPRIPKK